MSINFNPNLRRNDSLHLHEVWAKASKDENTKSGDIEKALRIGGTSPALARATAQSLKQDPNSNKSDALFEANLCEQYDEYEWE